MNEINVNVKLDEMVKTIVDAVNHTLSSYSSKMDKDIIMTKNQVCKKLHIGFYTMEKYIEKGLKTLPDGRISLFHLNQFLGKYPEAKNP